MRDEQTTEQPGSHLAFIPLSTARTGAFSADRDFKGGHAHTFEVLFENTMQSNISFLSGVHSARRRPVESEALGSANDVPTAFVTSDSSRRPRRGKEHNNNTLQGLNFVQLLAQRMAKLPPIPKKVVALYYYENMRLAEIAPCFGLSEDRIRHILLETLDLLRTYLSRIS